MRRLDTILVIALVVGSLGLWAYFSGSPDNHWVASPVWAISFGFLLIGVATVRKARNKREASRGS